MRNSSPLLSVSLALWVTACGGETKTVYVPMQIGPTLADGSNLFADAGRGASDTTGRENRADSGGSTLVDAGDADVAQTDSAAASDCPEPCDDGLPCTKDVCKGGHCIVVPLEGFCIVQGKCLQQGAVAGQPCQTCNPDFSIFTLQKATDGPCDDGSACTTNDVCVDGQCIGQPGPGCCKSDADCAGNGQSGSSCDLQLCNVATGQCTTSPKPGCCTSGVCCDVATQSAKQSGTPCSTVPIATEWGCAGAEIRQRRSFPGCDGASGSACSANSAFASWEPWKAVTTCAAGEVCVPSADPKTQPTCGKSSGNCTSDGQCNDGKGCTMDICSGGKCVNNPAPSGTVCGASKDVAQYRCNPSLKSSIQVRYGAQTCNGGDSCPVADGKNWGGWLHLKSCGSGHCQPNVNPEDQPKCGEPLQCQPDTKCCDAKGKWQPKATKCAETNKKVEFQCVGTAGGKLEKREGFPGCGGSSSFCSSSFTDMVAWTPWTLEKQCAADFKCEVGYSKTSGKCVDAKECTPKATCCDDKGFYAAKATQCGTTAYATETKCEKVGVKGSAFLVRSSYKGCTGQSTYCSSSSSNLHWTAWAKEGGCPATAACKDSNWGGKPTCETACTPNSTCCTKDGTFTEKATKCGSYAYKTEYKCTTTDKGGKVLRRRGYGGCSGSSTTCSSAAANLAWSEWETYEECAKNEVCSASSYSGTCKDAGDCLPSGKCCTEAGDYAKAGTQCGTWPNDSVYKCSSANKGAEILVQEIFTGCTGASGYSCSTKAEHEYKAEWKVYKKCPTSQYCKVTEWSKSCASAP